MVVKCYFLFRSVRKRGAKVISYKEDESEDEEMSEEDNEARDEKPEEPEEQVETIERIMDHRIGKKGGRNHEVCYHES